MQATGGWILDRGDTIRRRAGWTALTLPYVIGVVGWLAERRPPPPGDVFVRGDIIPTWWAWALPIGVVASLVAAFVWLSYRTLRLPLPRREGAFTLTDDALVIHEGGEEVARIDRRDVEHIDASGGALLGLRLRGGRRLALRMHDPDKERWAAALRQDVGRRRGRVLVRGIAAQYALSALAAGLFAFAMLTSAMFVGHLDELRPDDIVPNLWVGAGALVIQFFAAWTLRHRAVVIGAEGVRIDGLVRSRFIPHHRIDTVEDHATGARLHLDGGRRIRLPGSSLGADLVRAIRAARDRARAAAPPTDEEGLHRGDADADAWAARLRDLGEGTYRHAPIRIETLESIVDNPRQTPAQRVAAAVALSGQAEGRQRIAEIAAATAERELQAALEAAAEGDIDEARLARAARRLDD